MEVRREPLRVYGFRVDCHRTTFLHGPTPLFAAVTDADLCQKYRDERVQANSFYPSSTKIHAKRPARSQKEARRAVPAFDTNIACPPTGHTNARRFGLVYSEAYASCVSRLFIRCDRSSEHQAAVRTVGAYSLCRAECSGRVLGKCSYYGAFGFLCGRFFGSVLRSFPFSPWPHPLR